MSLYKKVLNATGWLVLLISTVVYYFSAERTGSLWDCGEFILGAYKLQIVHPPGAPVFLLVGRMFAWVAEILSDNPENVAFAVNLMSSLSSAFAAMFVAWITMLLGKLALKGREEEPDTSEIIALAGAGLVAGLATAFSTSIWFSAVEGEVYALSTFFTALTLWITIKWYCLPDEPKHDRLLILAIYMTGLSIGVHLLSILTFPAISLFYYFKKTKKSTFLGMTIASVVGLVFVGAVQAFIISGIPAIWGWFEILAVNSLGLPFNSGLVMLLIFLGAIIYGSLAYARKKNNVMLHNLVVAMSLIIVALSTYGMVITRAVANPPINMNDPSDAMRLIPYLNREQYGERALFRGPNFEANPIDVVTEPRYGRVGDRYEVVDQKMTYIYPEASKKLFPRMYDGSMGRPAIYKQWMGLDPNAALPFGRPNGADNFSFFLNYQVNWMYWRYFMWNFSGRQNGEQGYYTWDKSDGNWLSGIPFIDEARLGSQNNLTDAMKSDPARNRYFLLPFLFGVIGMIFHYRKRKDEFIGLLGFFIITGIGIIVYSNQPPNEPRERDYVLVGSFFTFCVWMGMGVLATMQFLMARVKLNSSMSAAVAAGLVLVAPILMGTQNFDDHSRMGHYGSRDYASNFLESCAPNAIIFTYGDNDTYPLWYSQEVEGIRRDVRVVNLSLIAVDWYIEGLRRKINDSPPIKLTLTADDYRGSKRNQIMYPEGLTSNPMTLKDVLNFMSQENGLTTQDGNKTETYVPTRDAFIPVNRKDAIKYGAVSENDSNYVDVIPLQLLGSDNYITKDDLAMLDVIGSNIWERPIYFAVTNRPDKLFGLQDYLRLEGLGLRLVPTKYPTDPNYGIIGSGKVDAEKIYENVTKKFKWGNFDKEPTFINKSYEPSVQSLQLVILRGALELLNQGDKKRSLELVDLYFSKFPDFNFRYNYRTHFLIDVYLKAGEYKKAKPVIEKLAENIRQDLLFYSGLEPEVLNLSYQEDYNLALRTVDILLQDASSNKDEAFLKKLQNTFAPFQVKPTDGSNLTQPIQQ